MKKNIIYVFIACLTLALSGCGNTEKESIGVEQTLVKFEDFGYLDHSQRDTLVLYQLKIEGRVVSGSRLNIRKTGEAPADEIEVQKDQITGFSTWSSFRFMTTNMPSFGASIHDHIITFTEDYRSSEPILKIKGVTKEAFEAELKSFIGEQKMFDNNQVIDAKAKEIKNIDEAVFYVKQN